MLINYKGMYKAMRSYTIVDNAYRWSKKIKGLSYEDALTLARIFDTITAANTIIDEETGQIINVDTSWKEELF